MKSEPDEFSIDDLARAPGKRNAWTGVRNYQARNFMRDGMKVGDLVFFYHSSCPQPGIAGIASVACAAYPDETQFDPKSKYYDPKATRDKPRWVHVDVKLVRKLPLIPLAELRTHKALEDMVLLQRGSRLSITPVSDKHWKYIHDRLIAA